MSDPDFRAFIGAMRELLRDHGTDPELLDVDEAGHRARLPIPDGDWFTIEREHLDVGGTPVEIAAAVYAVYREDRATA